MVELQLKGVTLDQALKAIADAAGLEFSVREGAYIIGPAARAPGFERRRG